MLNPALARPSTARPWAASPWTALGLAGAAALVVGVLVAALPPLAVVAGLVGLLGMGVLLTRPVLGLFAFAAVVATLPFGVIPVRLGVQLTFVDAVLLATFLALLFHLPNLVRQLGGFVLGGTGAALVLFVATAVAALIVGSGSTSLSADLTRRFLKLMASTLLFVAAVNLLRRREHLEWLLRSLLLGGALGGGVGTALWLLPPATQLQLLLRLAPLGYPTSSVLRYVPGPNETYTDQLRAIGTSVDPNVFGGTLMLAMAVLALQWVARDRLFPRPFLLLLALPTLAGLIASLSRASWVGLFVGVLLVGSLRYRRLWLWAALGLLAVLVTPLGQDLVERFVSGFSAADRATAFRLGEYRNALTLIQRYPLLGIGFGASPDIDVSAGVSSVYLLVGQQMGLLGLTFYLLALAALVRNSFIALRVVQDERLYGILAGLLAAFTAALVAGVADHYFANQVFPHAVALFWLYAALLATATRFAVGRAE